ncbi:hypothetical protein [Dyella telluris]|uniref:Uncharacterized protein n=1 Tax=Dyella telluris TaxID=2763498 RepID=A0A7G8Q4J8_9GAMM|nr:hypothetical protein [Dyella telluris]QNK01706.1 hypothetical protein H8F01_00555 [Dyella telluris]
MKNLYRTEGKVYAMGPSNEGESLMVTPLLKDGSVNHQSWERVAWDLLSDAEKEDCDYIQAILKGETTRDCMQAIKDAIPLDLTLYDDLDEPIEAYNYDKGFREALEQVVESMRPQVSESDVEDVVDSLLKFYRDRTNAQEAH